MVAERKEWQYDVSCRKCGDTIHSSYSGEYVICRCGAIAVDQTPHYQRFNGEPKDFIMPKEKEDHNNRL